MILAKPPARSTADARVVFGALAPSVYGPRGVAAGNEMVGKRVQFDDETWAALNLLRQERRRSFQQLAVEAFADLLAKYHRPADLKSQLRESTGLPPLKRKPRAKASA